MSAPALTAVAAWDVPLLRGAVFTLAAVADRLPCWRARMEAVGRSLDTAECWSGPAAAAAGAALVEVSAVLTGVTTALTESLEQAQRLLAQAATAQELAEQALAAAAAVPVELDDAGRPAGSLPSAGAVADSAAAGRSAEETAAALRAADTAADALQAAALAGVAATAAADALVGLGVGGPFAPAAFADLAVRVPAGSFLATTCPPGSGPEAVAAWWAGLSAAARLAVVAADPARIGSLDGVPAWARDRANRLELDRALADPSAPGYAVARTVAAEIADREQAGRDVQLYQFQPADGLAALALGDVDTADAVALLVPGVGNDAQEDLGDMADDARAVAEATVAAAPGLTVATVAWLGYRPPGNVAAGAFPGASRQGGPALDGALDGVAALRRDAPARVTVLAHSYGTVVADRAADQPGQLAADALVLLGSPGVDNDVDGMEAAEVYAASSVFDPVTWLEVHGDQTWDSGLGATGLPADWHTLHGEYYEPHHPTLAAMGEIVAGTRERE
ncbi:MAG TPA: alpha/beta hydrolase [Geodermatophilus sp.]|nr:alpha/beta hydrolase [Geodermatophilus sp.]